jgi:predicted phage terminase large subunit-like protein
MKQTDIIKPNVIDQMIKDRLVRTAIAKRSHLIFFHFYFSHYVQHETAPFQHEIFVLTEQSLVDNLFIVAFRGSAKSTIVTMSYPIWAILGVQQKKFVLIICQTVAQAKQHMTNLRRELENNILLKNDLGPFKSEDEWASSSLVFSDLNARITALSSEQSIRGLRHNQYRPDLIIGDDVEDINSTKTREGRNKTYQWLTSEVIPAGDQNTRLVIVGNLLHEDSLLMRLKQDLNEGNINGKFLTYPLLDKNGLALWPGKYSTDEKIEDERKKSGNEIAFQREYMLKIIPNEGQLVHQDWIQYYDELPKERKEDYSYIVSGVDFAIKDGDTNDYTAIVTAIVCDLDEEVVIYILPDPINRRMTFPETVSQIKMLSHAQNGEGRFYLEDVGMQAAFIQQLQNDGVSNVKAAKVGRSSKRVRLAITTPLIQSGKVLFPRKGAEQIIEQLVHFGVEKHDDLADAFGILVNNVVEENYHSPGVWFA